MKGLCLLFVLLLAPFVFSQEPIYTVSELKINDERPHFSLNIHKNKVYYISYLLNKNRKIKTVLGNPSLTVFEAEIIDGEIVNETPIELDSETHVTNVSSVLLSPEGTNLYITVTYNNKNSPKGDFNIENFHIEVGEFIEGVGWTNFKVLPFCNPKYSYGHPTFSKDGKTMYFIANIKGGKEVAKGASDIFKVDVLGNNTFGEPTNLGIKVNSFSKEIYPFISDDNTLYFASNRPNGYGGFDIYKSKMDTDGNFEKAEKLPESINSKQDDLCFVIDSKNGTGFFSSKRSGGKGEDDIYYFIS
ncbi:MAG: hypothetical protein B7Z06_11515, partial [Flavobacteriales bacterium 32-35-8]